jgi:lipopolysaccharide biosynthesis regulator YciM
LSTNTASTQNGNGHDAMEMAIRDIRSLAARDGAAQPLFEQIRIEPFEQEMHALLMESLDRLANGWIEQLKQVREVTIALEQQVINSCSQTKGHITSLHQLGAQIQREAKRGEEVCAQLSRGLGQIVEGRPQ